MTYDPHALFPIAAIPADEFIEGAHSEAFPLPNRWIEAHAPTVGTFWTNGHLALQGQPPITSAPMLYRTKATFRAAAKTWRQVQQSLPNRRPATTFYRPQYTMAFKVTVRLHDDAGNYTFALFGYLSYIRRAHPELELMLSQGRGAIEPIALTKNGEIQGLLMPCEPPKTVVPMHGPLPLRAS